MSSGRAGFSRRVAFGPAIRDEEILATPALSSFMRHAKTSGTASKMRELRQLLLTEEAPLAISTLHEMMKSGSDGARVKAAGLVLDYTLGKVEGVQIPERPFVDLVLGTIAQLLAERMPEMEAREFFSEIVEGVHTSLEQASSPSAAARAVKVAPSYAEDEMMDRAAGE